MTTPSIREALKHALASLVAAISLLERTPRAKKAAPSDKMFDQMIADYKAAIEQGRAALSTTPPQDVMEGIALDAETIQTLLDLLNPLHGSLDEQTYNEKIKENFDAPREYEHHVMVTWGQEGDLSQAVRILEDRKSQIASGLVTAAHPDEAAIRADERERCAKVAEESHAGIHDHLGSVARNIAAAIRAEDPMTLKVIR